MKPIKNLALLVNPHHALANVMAKKMLAGKIPVPGMQLTLLDWRNIEVQSSPAAVLKYALLMQGKPIDLVLVLGGDGTMMRACRLLGQNHVPLMGVNHGRLGFLTDVADTELTALLTALAEGHYTLEKRYLLAASINKPHPKEPARHVRQASLLAVNDIYLHKGEDTSVLEVSITVDGDFMQNLRADGLIISTPTGSTAYALSAGGPIVHPEARGLLMLGVAPHSLTNRPIVLPESSSITLSLPPGMAGWLYADGHHRLPVDEHHAIHINRSRRTYTLAHPLGYNFYHNLRDKLHWNEAPKRQ